MEEDYLFLMLAAGFFIGYFLGGRGGSDKPYLRCLYDLMQERCQKKLKRLERYSEDRDPEALVESLKEEIHEEIHHTYQQRDHLRLSFLERYQIRERLKHCEGRLSGKSEEELEHVPEAKPMPELIPPQTLSELVAARSPTAVSGLITRRERALYQRWRKLRLDEEVEEKPNKPASILDVNVVASFLKRS